jgi:hypothetical protein
MKYEHTREHMLPVIVELTYEDLLILQRWPRSSSTWRKLPRSRHMYKGDIRKLEREATRCNQQGSSVVKYAFPKEGND